MKFYIAAVVKAHNGERVRSKTMTEIIPSERKSGDYGCFINTDQTAAVDAAIKARNEWHAKGYGPYEIWAGELSHRVEVPVEYKLVRINS